MPQAKQRKSETPCSSQTLSSFGGQEIRCASPASDEETGGPSSEMDSEPLTTDLTTVLTIEIRPMKCNAKCCKDEGIGKPFQMSNHDILFQTKKRQWSNTWHFLPDWFKAYPWLVLCVTMLNAFGYFCRYCYKICSWTAMLMMHLLL